MSVCVNILIAQSVGTVEYTDCSSAEGKTPPPDECPGYDTKQSNGEVPVMLEHPFIAITPRPTLAWSGSP